MKTKYQSLRSTGASKKKQTKKMIIASVAVSAAGILGYFGWQYFKKKKAAKKGNDLDDILLPAGAGNAGGNIYNDTIPTYKPPKTYSPPKNTSTSNSFPATTVTTGFPLAKGSKGQNVKLLQQALITKYGKSILPKYGADGDFGSETVNALKKAGLPSSVTESIFNVLTQGTKTNTASVGSELYSAAIAKNYNKVISLLKQIQSVEQYSAANELFKQNRIGGVRQTIVNGLLNSFTSTTQKEGIRFEFLRMGLLFDGNKWSLSGFGGKPVVTTEATTVWISATEGTKVPARMVLGNEISKRLDYTLFENNGKYFLVTTKSIQYIN